ncbi:hypothetical protein [Streptomyces sp. NBC_01180]|uniref:hypothetical protein n=1 Tax=Streptomyces sp. NBC_01180 TaxID=2903763 RepID=UPI003864358F|nr:hypothetical protein OG708_09025 [Streptomyces sp. NBC_01180]
MFGSTKKTDEEKAIALRRRNLYMASGHVGIRLRKDDTFFLYGQSPVPVEGAIVTIDRGEAAKRITASRVLLTGPFALAMKKDNTKLFITVEGVDGSALIKEIPAGKEAKARAFELMVNGRWDS